MDNERDQLNAFKQIYKYRIEEWTKQIAKQFRAIAGNSKTIIEIAEKDSSIVLKTEKIEDKWFITYCLTIGWNEISLMHKYRPDMDVFECFMKLVSHEYMHVLCLHLDEEYMASVYYFSQGMETFNAHILSDPYFRHNPFFVPNTSAKRVNRCKAINKLNKKLFNVAADFEINSSLNIKYPFLNPSDYGLPVGLRCAEYYSILYHLFKDDKTVFPSENVDDFSIEKFNGKQTDYLKNYWLKSKSKLKELIDNLEDKDHIEIDFVANNDIIQHVSYGNEKSKFPFNNSKIDKIRKQTVESNHFSQLQGNLSANLEKLSVKNVGIWKDFRMVLNHIKSNERTMSVGLVDKIDHWGKFNNRKDDIELLYPGKMDKIGALERKLAPKSVMFVDISASMMEAIDPLYTLCYFLLKRLNITLVFYDTKIKFIFHKTDKFALEPFIGGGTNFAFAYMEYLGKYGKINHTYVLTDGYDHTLKDFQRKADIWIVNKYHVKKFERGENNGNKIST